MKRIGRLLSNNEERIEPTKIWVYLLVVREIEKRLSSILIKIVNSTYSYIDINAKLNFTRVGSRSNFRRSLVALVAKGSVADKNHMHSLAETVLNYCYE